MFNRELTALAVMKYGRKIVLERGHAGFGDSVILIA
jgi:hypothetical protein